MRLITRFELARKTNEELYSLLRQTFNAMLSGDNNHKRNEIGSMQNIQNELVLDYCALIKGTAYLFTFRLNIKRLLN